MYFSIQRLPSPTAVDCGRVFREQIAVVHEALGDNKIASSTTTNTILQNIVPRCTRGKRNSLLRTIYVDTEHNPAIPDVSLNQQSSYFVSCFKSQQAQNKNSRRPSNSSAPLREE